MNSWKLWSDKTFFNSSVMSGDTSLGYKIHPYNHIQRILFCTEGVFTLLAITSKNVTSCLNFPFCCKRAGLFQCISSTFIFPFKPSLNYLSLVGGLGNPWALGVSSRTPGGGGTHRLLCVTPFRDTRTREEYYTDTLCMFRTCFKNITLKTGYEFSFSPCYP